MIFFNDLFGTLSQIKDKKAIIMKNGFIWNYIISS